MLRLAPKKLKNVVGFNFNRFYSNGNDEVLPESAQVVIAGSGALANSVAYHLTKLGWNDILILEQNYIKSGTSHFSTGLIGLFKPFAMRKVVQESLATYRELETLGYNIGLTRCGSLNLAQTQDRIIALKRRMSYSQVERLECEFLTPNEIQQLHPYLSTDGLKGGVYVPDDCTANSPKLCDALIDVVKQKGVQYREKCQVQFIHTDDNHSVVGVETDEGIVDCDYFVNAAGIWSRDLGFKCSKHVQIPACSAEHYYLISKNLNIPQNYNLPCVRDYDSSNYCRQLNDELLVGWFEDEGQVAFGDGHVPKNWMKDVQGHEHEHLEKIWDRLVERYPILSKSEAPFVKITPDTYTPDSRWIMGESPDVQRYFVAVGTNGNSIQGAGGIGKYVAEWIVEGRPTHDLFPFSIQRFHELHNNRNYLQQRTKEIVSKHYQIVYPHQSEYKYARKLRTSPLYSVLEQRGGVFGTKMAYERALYFDTTYKRGQSLPKLSDPTFFKPKFFNFMLDENTACRETVGIIDISSFSKIKIKSSNVSDIVNYLQNLCCNNADIEIGACMKTGMLNNNGGYENECIIVRQTSDTFFMISPSSQQTRILEWMTKHLPTHNTIKLSDHTSGYTVLNVCGPKALSLISELTNSDINLKPFSYKQINIGFASDILVLSYSHTGDKNGFCLYIPTEYALHVYDELIKTGIDYGAKDVGTLTQRFMRVERFIPFMGEELTTSVTPLEAGLESYVDFSKDFLGKEALLKQKESGLNKRLVLFMLDNFDIESDIWPWGSEPIFRNSEYVGHVTTAVYSFLSGKMICFGFVKGNANVTKDYILEPGVKYHIDIANQFCDATPYVSKSDLPYLKEQQDELRATNYHQKASVFRIK